jgi:hypothetical protein
MNKSYIMDDLKENIHQEITAIPVGMLQCVFANSNHHIQIWTPWAPTFNILCDGM